MRKIIFLIVFVLCVQHNTVQAQAFEKGDVILELGVGFGIYGTQQKSTTNLSFTVAGIIPLSNLETHDTTDGAASLMIPISFEYAISNKFGIGADLTINKYFIDEKDRDKLKSVGGTDFGIKLNYHILNSNKNDLFVGLGLGLSSINWKYKLNPSEEVYIESASGSGSYFSLGIADRFYFSEKIGMLFYVNYKAYNYSDLDVDISQEALNYYEQQFNVTNVNFTQELDWILKGVNIGFGVTYKF